MGVSGSGTRLRILICGDSSAAGVGAPHQSKALSGQLVAALENDFRVEWKLPARSGATTAKTMTLLRQTAPAPFDVAVTAIGVNDATSRLGRAAFNSQQRELENLLRERFHAKLIIRSGLPPVDGFPALPQPLRWYLGQRASQFDKDLRLSAVMQPDTCFVDLRFTRDAGLMAVDGFHPGPEIYRDWGRRVAALIKEKLH